MRFRDELRLLPSAVWWLVAMGLLAVAPWWVFGR